MAKSFHFIFTNVRTNISLSKIKKSIPYWTQKHKNASIMLVEIYYVTYLNTYYFTIYVLHLVYKTVPRFLVSKGTTAGFKSVTGKQ